mmetsp:Transcript_26233/g.67793  ORF Transcript_26233/g.67793 Transcript_26233/m.67793 type:complete len:306 (-) Transcript_26233:804-1721(-)
MLSMRCDRSCLLARPAAAAASTSMLCSPRQKHQPTPPCPALRAPPSSRTPPPRACSKGSSRTSPAAPCQRRRRHTEPRPTREARAPPQRSAMAPPPNAQVGPLRPHGHSVLPHRGLPSTCSTPRKMQTTMRRAAAAAAMRRPHTTLTASPSPRAPALVRRRRSTRPPPLWQALWRTRRTMAREVAPPSPPPPPPLPQTRRIPPSASRVAPARTAGCIRLAQRASTQMASPTVALAVAPGAICPHSPSVGARRPRLCRAACQPRPPTASSRTTSLVHSEWGRARRLPTARMRVRARVQVRACVQTL